MKKLLLTILFLVNLIPLTVSAAAMDGCWGGSQPYGGYCEDRRWGWYGTRKAVRTAREAEKILYEYFSHEVKLGKIKEKGIFFEAEVFDKNNVLLDVVIINKRTGRIRSIY